MQPEVVLGSKIDRYELALEASGLGIWDNDLLSDKIELSGSANALFGFHKNDPVSFSQILSKVHPDDRIRTEEKIKAAFHSYPQGFYENEYRIIDPSNNEVLRWVRVKGRAYFNDLKVPFRFTGTIQDITGEIKSKEREQKLLALVDNSIELMSILENNGKNSYLNKAGRNLLGFETEEEVYNTPISELHTPEDIAFVEANVLPSVMNLGRWSGQMNVRHLKTGEIFPVYNNTVRIDDPKTGAPIAIGAVMRDMRPEMEIRKTLEKNEEELQKRVEQRTAELEKKNRELEEFTYVTSHDLQEPIRKMALFHEMIRQQDYEKLSPASKEKFDKMGESLLRLRASIVDLLSFATLDSEERFEEVDLNTTLKDVCSDLEMIIASRQAIIEIETLPTIRTIPRQMHMLFYNLLNNSLKFSREEVPPLINIKVSSSENGTLTIRFIDNGIGFAPEHAERIFGMFQRLHHRDQYAGTGIGLALCRKVISNMKGEIRAVSAPAQGAEFIITLPKS